MRSERGVRENRDKDIDTIPDIIYTTMTYVSQYGGWGGGCTRGEVLKGARKRIQETQHTYD